MEEIWRGADDPVTDLGAQVEAVQAVECGEDLRSSEGIVTMVDAADHVGLAGFVAIGVVVDGESVADVRFPVGSHEFNRVRFLGDRVVSARI